MNIKEKFDKEAEKNPVLKKWWFWVLVVIIGIPMCAGVVQGVKESPQEETKVVEEKEPEKKKEEVEKATPTPETTEKPKETKKPKSTKKPKKQTREDKITTLVQKYIDNYILTEIDYISVNEDLGTKKKGDYVVLVHLIWRGVTNRRSKENMITFSNDIAARMYNDFPKAQELAVFWDSKDNGGNGKMAFVRKRNGMYLDNEYWDLAFNQK